MIPSSGNWIANRWVPGGGDLFESSDPSTQQTLWSGNQGSAADVDAAYAAARNARESWDLVPLEERIGICREFAKVVKEEATTFAELISRETGKPLWESKTEAGGVAGKIELAVDAIESRRWDTEVEMPGAKAIVRYRPHGVLAVLGPFNLPAHLPNGHIVPAILAGNTVVFKPSEMTPAIGQFMIDLWSRTSLPAGVINLVQGGRETGGHLVAHPELDGLLFTGSSNAGIHFLDHFARQPEKIVALELGGNNPLIVDDINDVKGAAYQTILSAYITAGQRCTCARRLIVVDGDEANQLIDELQTMIAGVTAGLYSDDPEPFLGTVISAASAGVICQAQDKLVEQGGKILVELRRDERSPALLHPGLIDVSQISERADHEWFGPLLQVIRVKDFDAAIAEANRTRYGLAAGLLSDDEEKYERFLRRSRAGIINWNRQTTGASGRLPFGGVGHSGNHRPSGYFACDYCSYPVASLESDKVTLPEKPMTGIKF